MSKWTESYNYRRTKDKFGNINCVIYISDKPVIVSEEIYKAYSQMHRREMYEEQKIAATSPVSLEKLAEHNVPIDLYMTEHSPSAEDIVIEKENEAERKKEIALLPEAMAQLTDEERRLIQALFYEGISLRALARQNNVSLRAIQKHRDRILKKLKDYYENFCNQG